MIESVRFIKPATANGIPHKSNFKNGASGKSILAIWMGMASADNMITRAVVNLNGFEGILGTGIVNYDPVSLVFHSPYLKVFVPMLF